MTLTIDNPYPKARTPELPSRRDVSSQRDSIRHHFRVSPHTSHRVSDSVLSGWRAWPRISPNPPCLSGRRNYRDPKSWTVSQDRGRRHSPERRIQHRRGRTHTRGPLPVVCRDAGTGTQDRDDPGTRSDEEPKAKTTALPAPRPCDAPQHLRLHAAKPALGSASIGPGAPTQPPASKPIHRLERFNSAVTGAISCLVALSHFSISPRK